MNFSWKGWQHYRKIEGNAGEVFEENGTGVLSASGESAGSDLRALHGEQPSRENTVAGKAAKAKEKELEEWLRGLDGMDRLVDDYVGDKIPLWEKIMDRQGTVCCAWEKTAFEEGLKVGIRLMMEVYSL